MTDQEYKQKLASTFLDSWWDNLTPMEQVLASPMLDTIFGLSDQSLRTLLLFEFAEIFPGFPIKELLEIVGEKK